MNHADGDRMRSLLRAALTDAMKRRDAQAVGGYRTAIAAIDNAEAVPLGDVARAGSIETSPAGLGAADVPRRQMTVDEQIAVLRAEIDDRRRAADTVRVARPDRAAALEHQAALLAAVVGCGIDPTAGG